MVTLELPQVLVDWQRDKLDRVGPVDVLFVLSATYISF
jgi:hypothetical protein